MKGPSQGNTNPIPWPAAVTLGICAVLLGFFSDSLGGWGLTIGAASIAVVVPVLKYRRYWHSAWFWRVTLAMSVLQVPLVILVRSLVDRYKFGFNLIFASLDGVLVILTVNLVRPANQ